MSTDDFLVQPLARMARDSRGEGVGLSYIGPTFVDGAFPATEVWAEITPTLATAAWAEIIDGGPTITYRSRVTRVTTRPWKNGKESAWGYLGWMAADQTWGAAARQVLAQLECWGLTPPVPEQTS